MPIPNNYNYRPLPNYLEIKSSDIEGLGVFAVTNIDSWVPMGRTHIYDPTQPNNVARVDFSGFVNHSDEPNCEVYKMESELFKYTLHLRSIRRIKPGEELTVDYSKSLCGKTQDCDD